ncbi:4'-phosphopantetheinyl transferase superfamily protein [Kitasatospora sp. NPDC097643]|uniref:4'-phosphopantetheinyl transferase family protein n=1 Tax=Kitasatospora sp. NPDC097643 TaxID=3157230 RepID=UPI00332CFDC8
MIERILPAAVASSAMRTPVPVTRPPSREQTPLALASRRRAIAAGRRCARRALGKLGAPIGPLATGPTDEPLWPDGVVGAVTHCVGYAAAAVARAADLAGLGIDAEPHRPLCVGVLEAIALSDERAHLRELARARPGIHWERLLFSAKESLHRAWLPVTRRRLDFTDAEVRFGPAAPGPGPAQGRFEIRLLPSGPPDGSTTGHGLEGRWLVDGGLVATAVTASAAAARRPLRPGRRAAPSPS